MQAEEATPKFSMANRISTAIMLLRDTVRPIAASSYGIENKRKQVAYRVIIEIRRMQKVKYRWRLVAASCGAPCCILRTRHSFCCLWVPSGFACP